jgi:hypothetical protein
LVTGRDEGGTEESLIRDYMHRSFTKKKDLLNGVDLKISLTRSKPDFNIIRTACSYTVIISVTKIFARQVNIGAKERNVIEARLGKDETAK